MISDQVNSNLAQQNKTLPLSIFEMQFYQGDFVLQSQQQQSQLPQPTQSLHSTATKGNFISKQSSGL